MSRLDGADAERSARYQLAQNGVVATSLRSTLQRSSHVVDPPARWANRRSVPRESSADEDAQLQVYVAGGVQLTGERARASALRSEFVVDSSSRLARVSFRRIDPDGIRPIRDAPTSRFLMSIGVSSSTEPSTLRLSVSGPSGLADKLSRDVLEAMDQLSLSLSPSRSLRPTLAEAPRSSTVDDFLMAALATVDGPASSLCSDYVEWGSRIATSANRAPTAPTATHRHVTLRADAARRAVPRRAASRVPNTRRPRLRGVSDSQIAPAMPSRRDQRDVLAVRTDR